MKWVTYLLASGHHTQREYSAHDKTEELKMEAVVYVSYNPEVTFQ
jgi:hypothetical protein